MNRSKLIVGIDQTPVDKIEEGNNRKTTSLLLHKQ